MKVNCFFFTFLVSDRPSTGSVSGDIMWASAESDFDVQSELAREGERLLY